MSFFTLLERKVLGYAQLRKGPNKVGVMGLLQPFSDALKLFSKELRVPNISNITPFLYAPILSLVLALVLWILYPRRYSSFIFRFGVLIFFCVSSLRVYTTLAAGWTSNSKYALLGSLRGVAQTISYEVRIALILLSCLLVNIRLNIRDIYNYNIVGCFFLFSPLFYIWFTTTLAETNRTPFDFAEGESELVSGFNTEYRGVTFALIFIAEYINILFINLFSSIFFIWLIGSRVLKDLFLFIYCLIFSFIFIWVRGSFPRMRYDRLINLTWKGFLPFSLGILLVIPCLILTI